MRLPWRFTCLVGPRRRTCGGVLRVRPHTRRRRGGYVCYVDSHRGDYVARFTEEWNPMRATLVRQGILFALVCAPPIACGGGSENGDDRSSHTSAALGAAKDQSFAAPVSWGRDLMAISGWRKELHPRMLADVNRDGKKDLVGFGAAGVWLALSIGAKFEPERFVL